MYTRPYYIGPINVLVIIRSVFWIYFKGGVLIYNNCIILHATCNMFFYRKISSSLVQFFFLNVIHMGLLIFTTIYNIKKGLNIFKI